MNICVSKRDLQSISKKFSLSRKENAIKSMKMFLAFELIATTIDNRRWSSLLASYKNKSELQSFNCSIERFNKWLDQHTKCQHPLLTYELLEKHLIIFIDDK